VRTHSWFEDDHLQLVFSNGKGQKGKACRKFPETTVSAKKGLDKKGALWAFRTKGRQTEHVLVRVCASVQKEGQRQRKCVQSCSTVMLSKGKLFLTSGSERTSRGQSLYADYSAIASHKCRFSTCTHRECSVTVQSHRYPKESWKTLASAHSRDRIGGFAFFPEPWMLTQCTEDLIILWITPELLLFIHLQSISIFSQESVYDKIW
jgi:hypothetical protein